MASNRAPKQWSLTTNESISSIEAIRQHYGIQFTGSRFLDLANIKLKSDQRPEDLYQCLISFIEDNLLTRASGITHHSAIPETDEELSPSLENFVVFMWLQLLHPSLPQPGQTKIWH